MKGLGAVAALVVVVSLAAACGGSGKGPVQLEGGTEAAGGKALVFTATTDKKLASQQGGLYALELRGIDTDTSGASFAHPSYVDPNRCVGGKACEWTVAPAKSGTYEYRVYLLDYVHGSAPVESNTVKLEWAPPPRPGAIKLFINGQTPPRVPLGEDDYSDFPAGPMQVEARWTTDARGTGYYVKISDDTGLTARCSTGTSCRVPKAVPLGDGQEDSWTLELVTTRGNKVAGGFKVCVHGVTKAKAA